MSDTKEVVLTRRIWRFVIPAISQANDAVPATVGFARGLRNAIDGDPAVAQTLGIKDFVEFMDVGEDEPMAFLLTNEERDLVEGVRDEAEALAQEALASEAEQKRLLDEAIAKHNATAAQGNPD